MSSQEYLSDDDMFWADRESRKLYIKQKLEEGNFKEVKKYINKYGKFKWSNSELEEFCDTAWDYKSILYLEEHFSTVISLRKLFLQNAMENKDENTIKYLLNRGVIDGKTFIVKTNHLSYFNCDKITDESKISYIFVPRSKLISLRFDLPENNTQIVEYII